MKVFHCPGHGMVKNGILDVGCTHNGIVESVIVREICCAIGVPRVDAMRADGYRERAKEAHETGADFVICHHINAHTSPSARGLLVFYSMGDGVAAAAADMIERSAPYALQRKGHDDDIETIRGDWTRNANWVMSHYRKYNIPTVLIEWGFASNNGDAEFLLDPSNYDQIAACASVGIARAMHALREEQ